MSLRLLFTAETDLWPVMSTAVWQSMTTSFQIAISEGLRTQSPELKSPGCKEVSTDYQARLLRNSADGRILTLPRQCKNVLADYMVSFSLSAVNHQNQFSSFKKSCILQSRRR